MAAAGERVVDGSGDGEYLATRDAREPRRDQRARIVRGFDHQRAMRQAGDDAIALREMRRQRRRARRELRYQCAARQRCARPMPGARRGRSTSSPCASTATVMPSESSAPSWQAASMPSARPLVIHRPRRAKLAANRRAVARPPAVGLRLPTMASCGSCQRRCIAAHEQHGRRVGRAPQQIRIVSRRAGQQPTVRVLQPAQVGRDAALHPGTAATRWSGRPGRAAPAAPVADIRGARDPGSRLQSASRRWHRDPGHAPRARDAGSRSGSWRFIAPA